MPKGIIISAFATCGKSYLGKKYSNVIDLESSNYKYDNTELVDIPVEERKGTKRKPNPNFPNNYYEAILEAQQNYDVVLVQLKPEHFDYFDSHNIKYSVAYPNLNNWEEVEKRAFARNNNEEFIAGLKRVFKPFYEDAIKRKYEKFYILDGSDTLEDVLLKNNVKLIEKKKYKLDYHPTIKDFEEALHIEENYLEPSTIASVEQVISWDNKNNDIHIFVKDKILNQVVGEITLLPLSEIQFKKFINNELEDTEITDKTLLTYESNKSYYLLFSAIAIDPKYRNDRIILSLLLQGINEKINYLQNKNIKFLNMCAEGQTTDGQKFIESFLNLKFKKETKDGYKLYSHNNTQDFDFWLQQLLPEYIKSYNSKYNLK